MPRLPEKAIAAIAEHAEHVFEKLPNHIERYRIVEDTSGDSTLSGISGLVDYFVFDVTDEESESETIEGFEVGTDKIVFTDFSSSRFYIDYLRGSDDDPFDTWITTLTPAVGSDQLLDTIHIEDLTLTNADILTVPGNFTPDLIA
jgi:hypothetical protein